MNLLEEITARYCARLTAEYGDGFIDDVQRAREAAHLGPIVADVLDILSADGRLHPTAARPDAQHEQEASA